MAWNLLDHLPVVNKGDDTVDDRIGNRGEALRQAQGRCHFGNGKGEVAMRNREEDGFGHQRPEKLDLGKTSMGTAAQMSAGEKRDIVVSLLEELNKEASRAIRLQSIRTRLRSTRASLSDPVHHKDEGGRMKDELISRK